MFNVRLKELELAREIYLEECRKAIKASLKEFMEAHPEVSSLRWQQFAPSFNDGDPCEFSVNAPSVAFVDGRPVDDDPEPIEDGEDELEYFEGWDLDKGHSSLESDLESLHSVLSSAEDACADLFGNGSEVTIGRDCEAKVSEYYEG